MWQWFGPAISREFSLPLAHSLARSAGAWLSTNLPFLFIVAACIFFSLYKIK
jgi:hypothetical protein